MLNPAEKMPTSQATMHKQATFLQANIVAISSAQENLTKSNQTKISELVKMVDLAHGKWLHDTLT